MTSREDRDLEREGIRDRDRDRERERDKQHDVEHSNEKERDYDIPRSLEDPQRQDRRLVPSRIASFTPQDAGRSWSCSPSTNIVAKKSFTVRDSLDASSKSSVTRKADDKLDVNAISLKTLGSVHSIGIAGSAGPSTRGTQFSSPSLSPSPSLSLIRDLNTKFSERKQYGLPPSSASASASSSAIASKQSRPVQLSPASSVAQFETEAAVHKKLDILIVDDSRLNRKMLCKVLRCKGHVCDEAEDGLQAIAKVQEKMKLSTEEGKPYFDAILMDFVMPNMDGPTGTSHLEVTSDREECARSRT